MLADTQNYRLSCNALVCERITTQQQANMTEGNTVLPSPAPVFPKRLLTYGVAAIVVLLALSSFLTWRVGDQIRSMTESQIEVLTAAERVEHYGSVLELSIKAVVATGDTEAAARYRSVQPELRRTLSKLRAELRSSPQRIEVSQVDKADLALVALEYEALELVNRGNFAEARGLIHGPRYHHLVQIYFEGIREIEQRAAAHVAATRQQVTQYLSVIVGLSLASFGVLFVGWATIIHPARSWGAQLELARDAAEQTWKRLAESQAELKGANERLFQQARIDPLSRLQTRLKFAEDMEQVLSRVSRYAESYSIVMCDVDHFKQYNDTYGHVAGDEVLRSVAKAFTSAARTGDKLYRYGGEEFVLLLRTASLEAGQLCAERFRAAVEGMRIPHKRSPMSFVTVSMGVAQLEPGHHLTVESVLQRADAAMYRAKEAGRNRVSAQAAA